MKMRYSKLLAFVAIILAMYTFLEKDFEEYEIRYNCTYVGLWCSCYTKNNGGCSVGCSPNIYKTLYNQPDCPQISDLTLAGFSKIFIKRKDLKNNKNELIKK